ncbi:MAG TPA: phosphatase PAP2 family protein [Chitinophagaceae bacterium]|nr:phosphatase PAP2 family protein [Chitinophagaceae bacterium]
MRSTRSFNEKYFKKLPLGLIILLILFAATIFFFVFIMHEVLWEKEDAADNRVFAFLSANVISDNLTGIMKGVTYFASATFLQIAYGALVLLYLVLKNWKRAIEIAAIGIGGFVVNYFMKLSFHRLRPPNPLIDKLENFSFPSGHATSAFIFYGLLTYLVWKTKLPKLYKYIIGITLILFSLLIGFSRIYLRVHYPSDVLAGICIGFAWLILTIWLFEKLKKKSDHELKKSG